MKRIDLADSMIAAGLGGFFYGVWELAGCPWACLTAGVLLMALGLAASRAGGRG